MQTNLIRRYDRADRNACLAIFDANCPEFFAPNERVDYAQFLDQEPSDYWVCVVQKCIVGAFGVHSLDTRTAALNWILVARASQGSGIGAGIMDHALHSTRSSGRALLRISASHLSAPFFAKFGAVELSIEEHGWGPGMHRVEMQIPLP